MTCHFFGLSLPRHRGLRDNILLVNARNRAVALACAFHVIFRSDAH